MTTTATISKKITLQQTLYVAKNGNDSTALRNRLDKPFLTIFAARQASLPGDLIFVYPGIYAEGSNDIIATNVNYWFEDGSEVTCLTQVVSDYGTAKNINVDGRGIFRVLNVNTSLGVINLTNAASTIVFRGKSIVGLGNGIAIFNAVSFDIKVDSISSSVQYGATIRGNCFGILEFDTMNVTSTSAAIFMSNHGTDLVSRNIIVKGKILNSNNSIADAGVITHGNCNNTRFFYSDILINHTGVSGGAFCTLNGGGKTLFSNLTMLSTNGYGISLQGDSVLEASDCIIVSTTFAARAYNDGCFSASNTLFKTDTDLVGAGGAVSCSGTGEIELNACTLEMISVDALRLCVDVLNNNFRMRFTKLVGTGITESIGSSTATPADIMVEGDCSANLPLSADITNIIVGTSVIVDANIARNSQTLY
jgi:hypothetical protein